MIRRPHERGAQAAAVGLFVTAGAVRVARVAERARLPDSAGILDAGAVVAADAAGQEELLAAALRLAEPIPWRVERQVPARKRERGVVSLVSGPAVLGRVVARVYRARVDEFVAHERGNRGDVCVGQDAAKAFHRGAGTPHGDGM